MARPFITFDIDGVLCRPPFGINPGKGMHKRRDKKTRWTPVWLLERWRYRGRQPMPGALPGLEALASQYDFAVVSGRGEPSRESTEAWFKEHFGFVPTIHLRPSWRESSAQFKARKIAELNPVAHFEDDPHTAQWLAEIIPVVFLVDWPRNHWLEAPNVQRIHRIGQARLDLERVRTGEDPAAPSES